METLECLYIAGKMQNGTRNLEDNLAVSCVIVEHAFNIESNNLTPMHLLTIMEKHVYAKTCKLMLIEDLFIMDAN